MRVPNITVAFVERLCKETSLLGVAAINIKEAKAPWGMRISPLDMFVVMLCVRIGIRRDNPWTHHLEISAAGARRIRKNTKGVSNS